MSLWFKIHPKDKRGVSVPSDSCQVDILIWERWDGSLLQWLHCSQGSQAEPVSTQAGRRSAAGFSQAQSPLTQK